MDGTHQNPADVIRHRLLEGLLLRLARLPDASRFILRGGMLMRLWFRPLARSASDLDLVSTGSFDVEETSRYLVPMLADRSVDDGVIFDPERFRIEGIWLHTDYPGVRIFASGEVDGVEDDFSVDVTFGEPLVPEPIAGDYPMWESSLSARVWMCRPETIVGRKLHALLHMGMLHWRAKDLNDLRLLLGRVPLDRDALPGAIATSFTSRGNTTAEARGIFRRDWWTLHTSAARWQDFAWEAQGLEVPGNLQRVVAEVAGRLEPILERLP
jgi:hypothetical protein